MADSKAFVDSKLLVDHSFVEVAGWASVEKVVVDSVAFEVNWDEESA